MYVLYRHIAIHVVAAIFLRWTFISADGELQTSLIRKWACNPPYDNPSWLQDCRYVRYETLFGTFKKMNIPWQCPIDYNWVKTKLGELICYRRKDREFFSDFYKDCSDNKFSLDEYSQLDIDESEAIWSEYKNAYPGGPFYDTRALHLYQELSSKYKVVYQNQTMHSEEDLCIVIDPRHGYMAVRCDEKHYRYCFVQPMPVDTNVEVNARCKYWEESFCFSSPVPVCLREIKFEEKVAMYDARQPEHSCKHKGASSLLNKGWLYASHQRFEQRNQLTAVTEFNSSTAPEASSGINRKYTYLIFNQSDMLKSNFLFTNFICERTVSSRKPGIWIEIIENDKNLVLKHNVTNINDRENTYCFHDLLPSLPRPIIFDENNRFAKPDEDGYFWCIYRDPVTYYTEESNKILYIRDKKSLQNVYAVKFRVQMPLVSDIQYVLHLVEYLRHFNIIHTDVELNLQKEYMFVNKLYKNSDYKGLRYMKIKRKYRNKIFLYHVEMQLDMKPVPLGRWKDVEVLYVRPVYYCEEFKTSDGETIPRTAMNDTRTARCVTYRCVGDFNEGVKWMKIDNVNATKKEIIEKLQCIVAQSAPVDKIIPVFHEVNTILEGSKKINNSGRLLRLLDKVGSNVKLNDSQKLAKIVNSNIALLVGEADAEREIWGFKMYAHNRSRITNDSFDFITKKPDLSTQLDFNNNAVVVTLPASVVSSRSRVTFKVFQNDNAFKPSSADRNTIIVNSLVVSVTIQNLTQLKNNEVIEIQFSPLRTDIKNKIRTCAYWHFNEDDVNTGYWSQRGCTLTLATHLDTLDVCRCDHLTDFAEILVERTAFSKENETALEIISIIGCCLSILGLTMVAVTAAMFRAWRHQFRNKIWLQLCTVILIRSICFLIIVFEKFEQYNIGCMILGIILHYSVLCSFCWMSVAAVLSYRKLVLVFSRDPSHKLLRACVFAYGVPFIVIVILLCVAPHSYSGRFETTSTGSFCYPSGLGLWLAVFAPIAAMLLINCTLFIIIFYSVFGSKQVQRYGDSNETLRCASVSCLLAFLFGLPSVFGLFSYNIVAAYLFSVTATSQGFVLFLFFVLGSPETRNMWRNRIKVYRKVSVAYSASTNANSNVFIIQGSS